MRKYINTFWLSACLILLSTLLVLITKRYFSQSSVITIQIDYQAYSDEDLTLYWNTSRGIHPKNYLTQTTSIKKNKYSYSLRDADSLIEIRIDPDTGFILAHINEINITGLIQPIKINDFSNVKSNGLIITKNNSGYYIQRQVNNYDPNFTITIPPSVRQVNHQLLTIDVILYIISLVFSVLLFLIFKTKLLMMLEKQSLNKISLIFVFISVISSYWINSVLKFYKAPASIENRKLADKPETDSIFHKSKLYFANYTTWFNDHFPYKSILVHTNSIFKLNVFKTSPMPNSMFIGKNFEFYTSNELLRDDITGKKRLTDEEINYMYGVTLSKKVFLENQNISFYLTIPPSKQTTYQNLLPDYLSLQLKGKKMGLQFIDRLRKENATFYIDVIDLLNERHKKYPKEKLFYKYDIHWSEWGAFLGYQKLINTINLKHPFVGKALDFNEVDLKIEYSNDADLAKLILMQNEFKKERYIFTPKIKDTITETMINGITQFPIFKHYNPHGKGKLLMFRDSYTEQWRNLIAHHFKESVFIWDPTISQKLINEYKPDIVIQENCEMLLFYLFNTVQVNEQK